MRHWEHKKAIVAVAHTISVIISHLLKDYVSYMELGATYLEQRDREYATRRHVKQLECVDHRVIFEPVA